MDRIKVPEQAGRHGILVWGERANWWPKLLLIWSVVRSRW